MLTRLRRRLAGAIEGIQEVFDRLQDLIPGVTEPT
jgi:hypothetical protein